MSRPVDWWVLDRSDDPTPGDPDEIRGLAREFDVVATDAADARSAVSSLAGDQAVLAWIGQSGDVFRAAIGKFPGQLDKLHESYSLAASALRGYASSLADVQGMADRALVNGRAARDQANRASAEVADAQAVVRTASASLDAVNQSAASVPPPDPAQVSAAVRAHSSAVAGLAQANSQLAGAQAQLDAARRLADQAKQLREEAAGRAAGAIHSAADAGIPPDSFWHKLGEIASAVWHGIITVAKVVVAIGSIVALIVGGPIAWIVVGAALLVLADTVAKYAEGKASLLDVGFALLNCIPMTKGLTTLADLRMAFEAGGVLAAGHTILSGGIAAGREFLAGGRELVSGARELWEGREALPAMLHALPYRAAGRAFDLSTQIRMGGADTLRAFVLGLGSDGSIVGRFGNAADGARAAWADGKVAVDAAVDAGHLPALAATRWQGAGGYFGIDRWHDALAPAGTRFDALHPGFSGFVAPEGTFAAAGHDATHISQGLQVAPGKVDGATILHDYRPESVTFQVTTDTPIASGVAHANSQFGAGGMSQHFIPNLTDRLQSGDVIAFGAHGEPLTVGFDPGGRLSLLVGADHFVPLHNLDLPAGHAIPNAVDYDRQVQQILGGLKPVLPFVRNSFDVGGDFKTLYDGANLAVHATAPMTAS